MDVDRYDIDTTSSESTLTISDVVASDDGTYTCSAENIHGRDFASANLQVLCKWTSSTSISFFSSTHLLSRTLLILNTSPQ